MPVVITRQHPRSPVMLGLEALEREQSEAAKPKRAPRVKAAQPEVTTTAKPPRALGGNKPRK